jgi:hypothetical protein
MSRVDSIFRGELNWLIEIASAQGMSGRVLAFSASYQRDQQHVALSPVELVSDTVG